MKRLRRVLGVAVVVGMTWAGWGQPVSQVPLTSYSLQLLQAANQSNAWYVLGIVGTNQTKVTNWVIAQGTWIGDFDADGNALTNASEVRANAWQLLSDETTVGWTWVQLPTGDMVAVGGELSEEAVLTNASLALSTNGDVYAKYLSGNGGGLTNLNGTNIQAGTINSNKFDVGTSNLLALAGTGSGGGGSTTNVSSFFSRLYGNPYATQYSPCIVVTNFVGLMGYSNNFMATNSLLLLFKDCGIPNPTLPGGADMGGASTNFTGTRIRFAAHTNNHYWEWNYNPYHNGGRYQGQDEMQQTSSGGWAIGIGYFLEGVDENGKLTSATYYTNYNNARRFLQWGVGGKSQPIMYHLHSYVQNTDATNTTSSMFPEQYRSLYWIGETNGTTGARVWRVAGSMEQYPGSASKLPTYLFRSLDTNGNGAWIWYDDLSYYVDSNLNWDNQATATKRFQVIVGPDGGVEIKGKVVINGSTGLTTNFPTGTPGIYAYFKNGLLTSLEEKWDIDATNYIGRAGSDLTTTFAEGINAFVKALKVDGTWNLLDAIYPLCGADAGTNQFNLKGTNYTLLFVGSIATNNVYGLQGDGASGYANTQWKPANSNALALFLCVAECDNGASPARVQNAANTSFGFYENNSIQLQAFGNVNFASPLVIAPPTYPDCMMVTRTNDSYVVGYCGASTVGVLNVATQISPDYPLFLCARNASGSANQIWGGRLLGAAMGTNALSAANYATLRTAFLNLNAAMAR